MVWTLPEACLVVGGVETAVGMATPIPLAMLVVDEVVLDVLPAAHGLFECR